MKEERRQFIEFQRIEREVEHYKRIDIAWKYVLASRVTKTAKNNLQSVEDEIQNKTQTISMNEEKIKSIEQELIQMSKKVRRVFLKSI